MQVIHVLEEGPRNAQCRGVEDTLTSDEHYDDPIIEIGGPHLITNQTSGHRCGPRRDPTLQFAPRALVPLERDPPPPPYQRAFNEITWRSLHLTTLGEILAVHSTHRALTLHLVTIK